MMTMTWSLPLGERLSRRRGVGLASTVVVLLVAAVAMDRIAGELARDRMAARAAAAAENVRSWATAAALLDADPLAPPSALPHLLDRGDVTLVYREIAGGADELVIDWSGMPQGAVPVFQSRLGEWMGVDPAAGEDDRIVTGMTLSVDAVPLPRPELVLRAAPDMQAGMDVRSIAGAGVIEASTGSWADARVAGAAEMIRPVGSNAVRARTASAGDRLTAAAMAVAEPMGVPVPAQLVMAGGATRATVRAGYLTVGGDYVSDSMVVDNASGNRPVSVDVLVPGEGVGIDLAAARVGAVTTGSARVVNLVTDRLRVGSGCSGCRP